MTGQVRTPPWSRITVGISNSLIDSLDDFIDEHPDVTKRAFYESALRREFAARGLPVVENAPGRPVQEELPLEEGSARRRVPRRRARPAA